MPPPSPTRSSSPRWKICAKRKKPIISGAAAAASRPPIRATRTPTRCVAPRWAAIGIISTTSNSRKATDWSQRDSRRALVTAKRPQPPRREMPPVTDYGRIALHAASAVCPLASPERRKASERWLRGWLEYRRLQPADWVLMSWAKSGRTWLRVMLSRFYQVRYGLPASELLDFDNLHRRNPAAPRVFFTHNNYQRDYTGNWQSKAHFAGKKIVLQVRDPRDVAVSQFFQWQFRIQPRKKFLNDYPPQDRKSTR